MKRADDRVELVIVDLDAAAERGLQGLVIGLGDCAPAHSVKEGLQALGVVEGVWIGKGGFLMHRGAGFQFPDDLKFFAQGRRLRPRRV